MTDETMHILSRERPVGSAANTEINAYLEQQLLSMGFQVETLPFDCTVWVKNTSQLRLGEKIFEVAASPFSDAFEGAGELVSVPTADIFQNTDCTGKLLLVSGELAESPLMPKGYPFYFPEEHKKLIALLEEKKPRAIIAATGRHPMCGLDPFPLFEDGNFPIPSAYFSVKLLDDMHAALALNKKASLIIQSTKKKARSRQLVATRSGGSGVKIVLCAHMDTKHGTSGALDNAAGVAVMLETAKRLNTEGLNIEVVPFNSEEYYEASGELLYLKRQEESNEPIALLVNFDGPCYAGSKNAVSFYNVTAREKEAAIRLLKRYPDVVSGPEWYAGDHSAFAFSGTPCMVVTSSDIFGGALAYTHTENDTPEIVDPGLIEPTGECMAELIQAFLKRK